MAATKIFTQLVLSIIRKAHMVGDELDEATRERMQQRAEMLRREMTRLLQELEQQSQEQRSQEQRSQEQSGFAWGTLLFAALQQWQFWAVAAVLVLLFGLCWWLRKRSREPASSSKEGSSRNKAHKEEPEVEPSVALDVGRILANRLLDPPESFMMVEELVEELLCSCRKLSRNSFKPRLQPAIGVGRTFERWSLREDDAVYRLLVPLKPPHGHIFHLELGTAEEMSARNSFLRVELECTCMRERLVGDMLCFLHHPEEELRKNQGASLLRTLCTGPYLDMEKTTFWFQILVKAAWVFLPQSRHCRLTVLPSKRSCRLRLTNASSGTFLIEMIFGLQQGDTDTFLSIE
ncbi:inositol 1,4,5-trisphosphate receptor-interacting protein-like 1 [Phoenicopterus ruber ruber]